jgi:hypothetical protein
VIEPDLLGHLQTGVTFLKRKSTFAFARRTEAADLLHLVAKFGSVMSKRSGSGEATVVGRLHRGMRSREKKSRLPKRNELERLHLVKSTKKKLPSERPFAHRHQESHTEVVRRARRSTSTFARELLSHLASGL